MDIHRLMMDYLALRMPALYSRMTQVKGKYIMLQDLVRSDDWLFSPNYKILRLPSIVVKDLEEQHVLLRSFFVTNTGYLTSVYGHNTRRKDFDEYIVIYCLDGRGWYKALSQTWEITPGQALFVQSGIPHEYGSNEHNPWSIQWAHFRGSLSEHYLNLIGITPTQPVCHIGLHTTLSNQFDNALDVLNAGYSLFHLIRAAACIQQALSQMAFLAAYSPPPGRLGLNVEAVIQYMLEHLDEPRSLDDFATHACLSRSHFSRQYRDKTGYSPVNYFIRLKVQRVCELLETKKMTVREVARALGYEDQYYFSRLFKRITGTSPTQYRTHVSS